MQLEPVLASLRTTITSQAALAGTDAHLDAAIDVLTDALAPAFRQAAIDLAQQAALEVDAQLPEHRVSVVLTGDDLELRVDEAESATTSSVDEDLDARITLRLPPSLKQAVERVASIDGESVNSWVVGALSRRANRTGATGEQVTEEFDL